MAISLTPSPGGSADASDEWVELFINQNGLDLTNWTITLDDASDVTGDLTSTGAFDVSNYLSTTGGSFTDTDVGDYLVLGTVDGSGSMDNTITVTITDGTNTIDQVILDGGSNAPTGAATGTSDESVARIPNGTDTNINVDDFLQTRATLGTTNSPTGNVVINEVVTDPQQDWSSIAFSGSPPGEVQQVPMTNGWSSMWLLMASIWLAGVLS